MRCDTIHELFDDLDGQRLGACLEAEAREHLASCPACQAAYAQHRRLVASLKELPPPEMPLDLVRRLHARLVPRVERATVEPVENGRVRRRTSLALGFAATAMVGATVAIALPWMFPSSPGRIDLPAARSSSPAMARAADPAVPGGVLDGVTATVSGRSCSPSALVVTEGKGMDVTLSLNSPRPLDDAKVHVVLPRGLAFSPKAHPQHEGKKILTLREDLPRGDKDFRFRVKGSRVGKWDVVAVVEAGDSIVVSESTVEVAADGTEEETL